MISNVGVWWLAYVWTKTICNGHLVNAQPWQLTSSTDGMETLDFSLKLSWRERPVTVLWRDFQKLACRIRFPLNVATDSGCTISRAHGIRWCLGREFQSYQMNKNNQGCLSFCKDIVSLHVKLADFASNLAFLVLVQYVWDLPELGVTKDKFQATKIMMWRDNALQHYSWSARRPVGFWMHMFGF